MHIRKIKAKFNSLSKIIKIVESNKNITLINILKLSKQISFYFERANQTKTVIETIQKNYAVDSVFLQNNQAGFFSSLKSKNTTPTIWVYVTEEEQYSTNSYFKHEQNILAELKKNDKFIAIGERACNFVKNQNLTTIYSENFNDVVKLSHNLPLVLQTEILQKGFANIRFVINSSKIKSKYLDVLPLSALNFNLNVKDYKLEEKIDVKKLKVYPDVQSFIESEIASYLTYISLTLLSESALINQKYKLVAENQKINDLEKKQKQLKLAMNRARREQEVENMSLLSKKKDLLHE
ncbi:MSC_0622 family F1-like ATPase gamma subunit [Mycoplasma buteonis]|uniref:MSC_0622 family F1-like ATPase gamma subunit n=1 Tax=Mycoplasma buteonis TaxID=171280 RepID=UPI00055E9E61|nr:F0F1 ATP synthase subunit gamma [Mycoplasma buteonis]